MPDAATPKLYNVQPSETAITAVNANQAAALPTNGAGVVPYDGGMGTPAEVPSRKASALDGVRIPGKQPTTIRRRIHALFTQCPWLQAADVNAVLRYIRIMDRFLKKAAYLDKLPAARPDKGDLAPRKLDADLRADSAELTKLEQALGITASARAALGVNVARGMDLASQMAGNDGG